MEIKDRKIGPYTLKNFGHVTPYNEMRFLQSFVASQALNAEYRPLNIVEVGTWVGETAVAMALAAPYNSRIICIDTWQGNQEDWSSWLVNELEKIDCEEDNEIPPLQKLFEYNVSQVTPHCTFYPIRGESLQVAHDLVSLNLETPWDLEKADLIFIDAAHTFEAASSDIQAWLPWLAEDGILCGHDYDPSLFPGVCEAVGRAGFDFYTLLGTSIWVRKQIGKETKQ